MNVIFLLTTLGCKKQVQPVTASAATCSRPDGMFGPVVLPDDARRYGEGVTALAEAPTSKAKPIEVCGVNGQLRWLMAARCEDGTAPFNTPQGAHAARVGSMGSGGQCDSVIDLYTVPCPEGEQSIYMDLYMCRVDENMLD